MATVTMRPILMIVLGKRHHLHYWTVVWRRCVVMATVTTRPILMIVLGKRHHLHYWQRCSRVRCRGVVIATIAVIDESSANAIKQN